MNIEKLIQKCVETPGISLKQGDYSITLLLKDKKEKGSMTFFSLFPGITLAYIFVNSRTWPAPELCDNGSKTKGPLLLNYCVTGRCELFMSNKNFVYVKDEEISLTECFAQKQYVYPRRIYNGLEYFIDIDVAAKQSTYLAQDFELDFRRLTELYCPEEKTYISPCTSDIKNIFKKLWSLFGVTTPYTIAQMRVFSLAIFTSLLNEEDIPQSQPCKFFTETQVRIAKQTEKIITADLRKHHPAWELAARFSISETSLKNYFRGVFGQNISVYLRETRMNKAADLLGATKKSVAEISTLVGYINQSKFSSVFKKQFNVTPLEYRREKNIEES